MESVEIAIYIGVAIIVGVMILSFIAGIDYTGLYEDIKGDGKEFERVDNKTFAGATIRFWESCGLGAVAKEEAIYFTGGTQFTKDKYFDQIIKLNMCNSIQSASRSCGTKENVVMANPINPPQVIKLECDPVTEELVIHS